jgi:hypothetical protein
MLLRGAGIPFGYRSPWIEYGSETVVQVNCKWSLGQVDCEWDICAGGLQVDTWEGGLQME